MDQRKQSCEVFWEDTVRIKKIGPLGRSVSWDSVSVPNLFKDLIQRPQLFCVFGENAGRPQRIHSFGGFEWGATKSTRLRPFRIGRQEGEKGGSMGGGYYIYIYKYICIYVYHIHACTHKGVQLLKYAKGYRA